MLRCIIPVILCAFSTISLGKDSQRFPKAKFNNLVPGEYSKIVANNRHNSNTDLISFEGKFYLVHADSPFHIGTKKSKLVIRESTDGVEWNVIKEFAFPDRDIRDPKFAIINDKIFLYALPNNDLEPAPYGTVYATSQDFYEWSEFRDIDPKGWLFWRPKTKDGNTWYVTAYWHEHGKSALFKSTNGIDWEQVSLIHTGDRNDETALEFLPDGRMLITARLEGDDRAWHQGSKNAATLIATSEAPYTSWKKTVSKVSRLDGPVLFPYNDKIYAVGRYDPEGYDKWFGNSSLLGRKRTALYEVQEDKLILLGEFPSVGDTSYAGVVIENDTLYVSYYTNDPKRDVNWLIGLVLPSDIYFAKIDLSNL